MIPVSANSDRCDLHPDSYRSTLKRIIWNFDGENILVSFDYASCVSVHVGLRPR